MRTIDIGIGHDDDLVITQVIDIERLVLTQVHTEGAEHVLNLLRVEHLVDKHLLDIQDLTTQRKDGLIEAIASRLGGTTCRVTLDQENLTFFGILARAVGQFAWQATACELRLLLHILACLTGSDTSLSC